MFAPGFVRVITRGRRSAEHRSIVEGLDRARRVSAADLTDCGNTLESDLRPVCLFLCVCIGKRMDPTGMPSIGRRGT